MTAPRPAIVRAILWIAVAMVGWHVAATFLWIAPVNQLRQLIPGDALTRYMIPFFGQSWSVFAPEPINGDFTLRVRAQLGDGDDLTVTRWVDASATELSMSRHNLFPPRAANLATQQAMDLKTAYDRLTNAQRGVAGRDFARSGHDASQLERSMGAATPSTSDAAALVDGYLAQDRRTTAYATQVAKAMWGAGVTRVQFHVWRQDVVPFAHRNDPAAKRSPVQDVATGWRSTVVNPGQDDHQFAEVFRDAAERAAK